MGLIADLQNMEGSNIMIKMLAAKVLTPVVLKYRSALWLLRRQLNLRESVPGNEKLCVVLLSYKRMRNMCHIVDSLLLCDFVHEIILSNNNPEVRMEDFMRIRDPRLRIINQSVRCLPNKRYELARDLDADYFLCIDDDLFLTPGQVRKLFMALIENPAVPHGVIGQDFLIDGEKIHPCKRLCRKSRETDVIMWAYAFTREHLVRYFRLLDQLNIDSADLLSDDMFISFSGKGRARCENLGNMLRCGSSDDEDKAIWMERGFFEQRCRLYLQCRNSAAGM